MTGRGGWVSVAKNRSGFFLCCGAIHQFLRLQKTSAVPRWQSYCATGNGPYYVTIQANGAVLIWGVQSALRIFLGFAPFLLNATSRCESRSLIFIYFLLIWISYAAHLTNIVTLGSLQCNKKVQKVPIKIE